MSSITSPTQRPITPTPKQPQLDESPTRAPPTIAFNVTLTWPFSIPSTSEATIARILKNTARFKLLYALFIWTVLAIALIPCRKVSLLLLSVMGNFTLLYVLMLRVMPDSMVLHKLIDKKLVAVVVVVVTTVLMIVTRAGIHLLVVVASTIPVILTHAVLVTPDHDGWFCRIGGGCREGDAYALLGVDEKSSLESV